MVNKNYLPGQFPNTGGLRAVQKQVSFILMLVMVFSGVPLAAQELTLHPIGSYRDGAFDEGAAEIVKYDPESQRLFVVNGDKKAIDVLDIQDPANPALVRRIDVTQHGGGANGVDVRNGLVAVAVQAEESTDPGYAVIFNTDGRFLRRYQVGSLPDDIQFTPDGNHLLVANEGEPNDDYSIDPEGSITIISRTYNGVQVRTAGFGKYNWRKIFLKNRGIRLFGPNANVAQDLEPESITISPDGQYAFVTLQENNAYAIVDIEDAKVVKLVPLGVKNHGLIGDAMDASDRDDRINIKQWPVFGMYQPDGIASFMFDDEFYLVMANEGDARDYDTFSEEARVKDLELNDRYFKNIESLQEDANLGRLTVTNTLGESNGGFKKLYAFGGRSFSIRNARNGDIIYDSGNEFEQITADRLPDHFNSNNDDNDSFDSRSDAKGPEPEGVTIGVINGRTYAFIGLERTGGIMMYDITNPYFPEFIDYVNNRNFNADAESAEALDLGPEGLVFISAEESPNGLPLLVVGNEVSGTTTIFEIKSPAQIDFQMQILHASDLEGGVEAIKNAPNFAAIIDGLEDEIATTVRISSGDNYIPGPFFGAAGDGSMRTVLQEVHQELFENDALDNIREGDGRADISIMNIIGFDASAIGNHEFDAGTNTFGGLLATDIRGDGPGDIRWLGTQFPYLSANLDFGNDGNLNGLFTDGLHPNTSFRSLPDDLSGAQAAPKIAPYTYIEIEGEKVGVVGATTQLLESITSNGDVQVIGPKESDMDALAEILQPKIDELIAEGIDKIMLVTHLQQFALEQELITKLSGVDVVLAGGSDALLANPGDPLQPGDEAEGSYPFLTENADGDLAVIVGTPGEYSYVGRLVVDFDEEGRLINTFAENGSGVYATTDDVVEQVAGDEAFAVGSKGALVKKIADAVNEVVTSQDADIYGNTTVYLEGRREAVRTQETNLGNLSADANLAFAQSIDSDVRVSIKNGGGIRAAIGEILDLGDGVYEPAPPQANPITGKLEGQVSQLDIKNSLRFNNALSILELTASGLLDVVEHAVSATAEGATPGQFPQIGGMAFSFDPTADPGSRVQTLVLQDSEGNITEYVVENGEVSGDPDRTIKVVTLNFLAGGGDGYPFEDLASNRRDLDEELEDDEETFEQPGTEQDALARYLADNFSDSNAFSEEDSSPELDERIQNLMYREDGLAREETASIIDEERVKIYPVPLQRILTIELPAGSQGRSNVVIRDSQTGQIVVYREISNNGSGKLELDVSAIRNRGAYIISVQLEDGTYVHRNLIK